jgi:glutathione S-transferase
MTLRLYFHPFSSYCQKVLIALYERDVPFEKLEVNLSDPAQRTALEALWPVGKFPVLEDTKRGIAVPEASLIVEYLDRVHEGPPPLVPVDPDAALQVRILDRLLDNYLHTPMQDIVGDAMRPEDQRDPAAVTTKKAQLARAYGILDERLTASAGPWAAGATFTLADCAAAPALFYAGMLEPFDAFAVLADYYSRLRGRPSFSRAVDEARPYRAWFPPGWTGGWD